MDAEILFFMTAKDQSEFLEIATKSCDSVSNISNSNNMKLHLGSCYLIFKPSSLNINTLYTGSLEIRSSLFSTDIDTLDKERTKTVFRKLRNWIKKYYWSRLAYLNQNNNQKLTPSRNHWLGPDAKSWKESSKKHMLKLSSTSWMIFEIGY